MLARLDPVFRRWTGSRAATVVDHLVSSGSNWIVLALAARSMEPSAFGAFAGAQAAILVLMGCTRGLFFEPLLLQRGVSAPQHARRRVLRIAATAAAVSVASGLLLLLVSGHAWWAVVVALAGLIVGQDGCRYVAFADGRPRVALALDSIWMIVSPVLLVILANRPGTLDASQAALAWVAAGAVSAMVGVAWAGRSLSSADQGSARTPRLRQGLSFTLDFLLTGGLGQLSVLLIGLVASARLMGSARLALASLGALTVMRRGDLTHLLATTKIGPLQRRGVSRQARSAAVRVLPAALAASVAMVALHPLLIGRRDPDLAVIFAMGTIAVSLNIGANRLIIALRASDRDWHVTHAQLLSAPAVAGLPIIGAAAWGGLGFGLGVVLGTGIAFAALRAALNRAPGAARGAHVAP